MKLLLYFWLLVTPPALANQTLHSATLSGAPITGAADFLSAHNAFLAGATVKLGRYALRLKKSPLEVYVRYYQLSLALKNIGQHPASKALDNAVKRFLSRPEDTPVIDLLRGEWLKVLGKMQQWNEFDAEYPHLRNKDSELACYALQSMRRNREMDALREARKLWFTGKELPNSCKTLFNTALSAGIISKQDIGRRLRLALEANNLSFAIHLSAQLDNQYAGLPAMLRSAAADPGRYLRKITSGMPSDKTPTTTLFKSSTLSLEPSVVTIASAGTFDWRIFWSRLGLGIIGEPSSAVANSGLTGSAAAHCDGPCADIYDDDTVPPMGWNAGLANKGQRVVTMFALERLAKQSTDLAAAYWVKLAGYFPVSEQHYCYARLAYQVARNLNGRTLQWFRNASDSPLNEQQSAWRVRTALRALDWPEVLASVNAMSTQQQQESAWLYWKARAFEALGKTTAAREIFAPLSSEYSFYGLLAHDELTGTAVISQALPTYKPDSQAIATVSAMPGVQRTLTLYRIGMRSDALEEWRWVVNSLSDRELLTAAEIARRNKMYDRAIGAADKTVNEHDFSLRYLAPYRADLQILIRKHDLDEAWVYGLMRQESRFATSAKSDSGAAGLMQIMPATARWVAGKLGLKRYRKSRIHQLDTNFRIGTYYMKSVLSRSENNPVLASAAYNAGPIRALKWRADKPLEGAIYAETIPYQETRNYVKKVMRNTFYYATQFGDFPRSFKQRLGIVPAKPVNNPTANNSLANTNAK